MSHTCHARGCDVEVPPRMLMCAPHWRMVPKHLQREVWRTYKEGQENRKDPTPAYLRAAEAAIQAVWLAEQEARRQAKLPELAPETIRVWTDGSCIRNPGPGGWAALVVHQDGKEQELVGGEQATTNNRMELMGAIAALESLRWWSRVRVVSDSQYLIKGITVWIHNWKRTKWHEVKNRDLWERLEKAAALLDVEWEWVRSHSGVVENERVDKLAGAQAELQARGTRVGAAHAADVELVQELCRIEKGLRPFEVGVAEDFAKQVLVQKRPLSGPQRALAERILRERT